MISRPNSSEGVLLILKIKIMTVKEEDILICIVDIKNTHKYLDIFKVQLDVYYTSGHFRKAVKLEQIAYKKGLRNLNDIKLNIPIKPNFVVDLNDWQGSKSKLNHTTYKEICEYLDFPKQSNNYKDYPFVGYLQGITKTWINRPYTNNMRFINLNRFIDYIFEHWVKIDLTKEKEIPVDNKVLPALSSDTDTSKDYCVYLPNKEHHKKYEDICIKHNIPHLEWSKFFTYYGVYGGVTIRLGSMFGVRPYKNYDYFENDSPDYRFGLKKVKATRIPELPTEGSIGKIYYPLIKFLRLSNKTYKHEDKNENNTKGVWWSWHTWGYYYGNSCILKNIPIQDIDKYLTININNQLKTIKQDEKLLTKISGPTERRSYNRTRQITIRRKPNSTTERCFKSEKRIRKTTKRIGQISSSKRIRL